MLVSPVVVILWSVVTTTIATPPPGYIKPTSENDKDPPNYRYTYTIDNDNGIGQGKVEARSGELASGQYYINNEGSSTDVKYFADEWGYHPLVKYTAANSHSVANAQLAFGEDSVKALVNDTNFDTQKLLSSNAFSNQYKTTVEPSTESHFTDPGNNLSVTNIEEALIIENAGSFGQRLPDNTESTTPKANTTYHTTPGLSAYSTPQPIIHDVTPISSQIEQKNVSSSHNEVPIYNYKTALESIRQYFGLTNNEQEEVEHRVPLNGQVFHQEFSGLTEHDETKPSQDSEDNSKPELLERPESQVSPRLSKPIVVAEVPNSSTERYEYSTTFPCNSVDDETVGSVTPSTIDEATTTPLNTLSGDTAVLVSSKLVSQSVGIPTSSVILNPIQAGVALVNAGEAHLLSSDVEHSLHSGNIKEATAIVNSGKTIGTPDESYEAIKSKFNGYPVEATLTSNVDQTIEIQKSHEIYAHSLPIQEIHYPGEFVSQVVSINQVSPEYLNTPVSVDNVPGNSEIQQEKLHGDIGNGNLRYQSIIDRPELTLQELETSPEGSSLLYQADSREKNNVNNLVNSANPVENYAIQKNTPREEIPEENITGETNFSADTRIKPESVYSAVGLGKLLQNVLVNVQQTGVNSDIVKRKQENASSNDNTKSSLQRFLAEERQQNVYGLDTHITSSSVSPTETEMKEISSEIQEPTLPYSLSKDLGKNTIYIHGPTEQGLLLNIGNYASQPTRVYDKPLETGIPNAEKVQEINSANVQQDAPVSAIYPIYTNRIFENPLIKQYPFPAQRIIDNKIHHPVHKLVVPQQYYPVHIIQSYPSEKLIEKNIYIPQQYPVQQPPKAQHAPLELANYVENSINLPYGVQYGVSYQQIMNPPSNNVYEANPIDQQIQTNASKQEFQGYNYDKPIIPFATNPGRFALTKRYGSLNQLTNNQLQPLLYHQQQPQQQQQQQSSHTIYPKKIHFANQVSLPLHSRSIDHQIAGLHRHLVYRTHDKGTNKNQEYIGPVPLPQPALNLHQQNQVLHPLHQETLRYLANAARSNGVAGGGSGGAGASNFWRTRLPEAHYHARTSNFRQSKMEYGFKPPMVPSVQYDEQTATRVES